MEDVVGGAYGDMLTFWNWKERTIMQQIKMHGKGLLPLENRFLHDPDQSQGFTGAALSSNIIHFSKVRTCLQWLCHVATSAGVSD